MKVIGVTGASGSGKSTFVKMLAKPIIDADKIARKVVEKGEQCLDDLVDFFGKEILEKDGELNRRKLAEIAFSSKENTLKLNEITHPYIVKIINEKIENYRKGGEKAIILDAPQLFEAGCEKFCDLTVAVIADKKIRLKRITARDKISEADALKRINSSLPDSFFKEKCDMVIINNENTDKLQKEALNLIKKLGLENGE